MFCVSPDSYVNPVKWCPNYEPVHDLSTVQWRSDQLSVEYCMTNCRNENKEYTVVSVSDHQVLVIRCEFDIWHFLRLTHIFLHQFKMQQREKGNTPDIKKWAEKWYLFRHNRLYFCQKFIIKSTNKNFPSLLRISLYYYNGVANCVLVSACRRMQISIWMQSTQSSHYILLHWRFFQSDNPSNILYKKESLYTLKLSLYLMIPAYSNNKIITQ